MRNTLYRQMVYWINAHRTWIEVAYKDSSVMEIRFHSWQQGVGIGYGFPYKTSF